MQLPTWLQGSRLKDRIICVLAGAFGCFFIPEVTFSEDYHYRKDCPYWR